jgi:predicted AlkP superfamily phosphohydrolase/phosphomutase
LDAPRDPRIREVDDLRRQLRSLGYLDAGVDRFVLAPAEGRRGPMTIAWLASVRIGVLAALLLGPGAAIGAAARVPGLITGARDGFVVAAYLGLLFGAASSAAAFAISLAATWLARQRTMRQRPRGLALTAGTAFTIACLAYLTLWWDASTFNAHAPWRSVWTLVPLAFATAVSVLLGHLVTVTTLAVAIRHSAGREPERGVPGSSRLVLAAAGVLTFAGALLLFSLTTRSEGEARQPPALTVVSSGVRVRLIAIDGFDPRIARRLAEAGRVPALATLLGGSTAVIDVGDTRDPARAWTTIATGQPPEIHAVHGLETRRVAGVQGSFTTGERAGVGRAIGAVTDLLRLTTPAIASGSERRAKTFWEVATAAGLRTVVVNWWATWPAPRNAGLVITDRATLRLERGGMLDAEIAPAATYAALHAVWPALRTEASAHAAHLRDGTEMDALLRRSAELDALQMAITRRVTGATADLVCTYLPGLDLVQHELFGGADAGSVSPAAAAERLETLDEYYVLLDALLSAALGGGGDELLMVLTSPGRVSEMAPGLLLARGTAINRQVRDGAARPIDVTPTILQALGIPISRELAGRPLVELFSADFARRYPVREVSTYGPPSTDSIERRGQPLDQEMIDRLRSLGYVR